MPEEYSVIYWAAACLSIWAGRGCCNVTDGQLAEAINMICDKAGLTLPQEVLLKRIAIGMIGKGEDNGSV